MPDETDNTPTPQEAAPAPDPVVATPDPAPAENVGSALLAQVHAEIDTFWQSYFINVAVVLETRLHNYLEQEKDALKERIANLL